MTARMRLESQDDLSIAYTPGVARPCGEIATNPGAAWDLTWKGRTIAPTHGGINLEDFSAPRCFAIGEQLQDQHPRPARRSAWYGHRSARCPTECGALSRSISWRTVRGH